MSFPISCSATQRNSVSLPVQINLNDYNLFSISFTAYTVKIATDQRSVKDYYYQGIIIRKHCKIEEKPICVLQNNP